MKHKIIIADDSTSIQKFAKITLTSQGYDVVTCLKSQELMGLIQEHNPVVVLLDFNLSESKTGYDLSREIKSISTAKVIMLYGTFDTIDDSLFVDSGVAGHLVKPFDEAKLVNLCKQQVSDLELDEELQDFPASIENEVTENSDEIIEDSIEVGEEWVVNQPEQVDVTEPSEDTKKVVSSAEMNSLEAGIQDWGIDVPGIIGVKDSHLELPPIIGEESNTFTQTSISIKDTLSHQNEILDNDAKLISESDFQEEYVDENENIVFTNEDSIKENDISGEKTELLDLNNFNLNEEDEAEESEILQNIPEQIEEDADVLAAESKIEEIDSNDREEHIAMPSDSDLEYPDIMDISSSELEISSNNDIEIQDDFSGEGLSLNDTAGTNSEEEVKELENMIADEVEVSGDELWSTDEVLSENEISKPKSSMEESLAQAKNFLNDKSHQQSQIDDIKISEADIEKRIETLLAPMVERMVNDRIDQIIEKVSWEVIPDLAENMIKKELQRVTNEVLNDN